MDARFRGSRALLEFDGHPIEAAPRGQPWQSCRCAIEGIDPIHAHKSNKDGPRAFRDVHAFVADQCRIQQHLANLLWLDPGKRLIGPAIPEPRAAIFESVIQQNVEGDISIVGVSCEVSSFVGIVSHDEHINGPNGTGWNTVNPADQRCQSRIQLRPDEIPIGLSEWIRDDVQIRGGIKAMAVFLPTVWIIQQSFHSLVETRPIAFIIGIVRRREDFVHALQGLGLLVIDVRSTICHGQYFLAFVTREDGSLEDAARRVVVVRIRLQHDPDEGDHAQGAALKQRGLTQFVLFGRFFGLDLWI
mmetsp:Transcript_12981/g.35827  ORF Transcript_12981/g.35827 Transcript_12981/m.35827 type:complete len:302 (+) Transcript_12981:429-1334(+)